MKFTYSVKAAELRRKAPVIIFVFSLMFWSFAYGVAVQKFALFPYRLIRDAEKGAKETRRIIMGELPRYHRSTHQSRPVIVHRPEAFSPGLTLVSGLTKEDDIEVKVITPEGEALHRWRIDWFNGFWPDPHHIPKTSLPRRRPATFIHGIALLKNGDLVFNLERLGMARVELCGNVVWRLPYQTHHAVHVEEETGNIWVAGQKLIKERSPNLPGHRPPFWEFTLLKVTPGGDISREISVPDLLIKNGLQGLLYMSATKDHSTQVTGDTLHLNDIEVFPSHLQAGVFQRGDVMISLRNIHAVLVFNPDTLTVKYLSIGKVVRQHDPDFIDGETISIFDNNLVRSDPRGSHSRIVVVSARNHQVRVLYSGSAEQPFYTDLMGKHQWLPNGNILITESTEGRAFEIDPKGELVWEYFNLIDKGRLALMDEAQRLPAFFSRSFFEGARRTCGKTQAP
jgi:hypothetical protein